MSDEARWRVTPGDVAALAAAVIALSGAWTALDRVRARTDPRRALVSVVRAEATAKDLVIVADEGPEILRALAPLPAMWGVAPMDDLSGVRRVYGMGGTVGALGPLYARFGTGRALDPAGRAVAWDLAAQRVTRVTYDANVAFNDRVNARREGGGDAGECPREGAQLACKGPEWHRLRVEPHMFDGAPVTCLYAHPHADGTLVIVFEQVPASRALVGTVGIDDVAFFPEGTPVQAEVLFSPTQGEPVRRTLVAPNRKGVTPYRIELPEHPGTVVWRISSPNIASRQLCFTMRAVR